jgi:hypothetical protein
LALMLSSSALAQTIQVLIDNSNKAVVSSRQCDTKRLISWTASVFTGWCPDNLQIWVTTGECTDAPGSGDTPVFNTSFSATDRTFQLLVSDLPIFHQADAGFMCGDTTINQVHKICASAKFGGTFGCTSPSVVRGSNPPTIEYRGKPPPAPTITSLLEQDSALTVEVSTTSDVITVHVQVREAGTGDFVNALDFNASAGRGKVEGLTNGTLYEVRVVGEDAAGNLSDPSGIVQGTPVKSDGFYATYRREGGADLGGCGDIAGGRMDWRLLLIGLGFLPLLWRKRSCRRDS